MYIINMNELNEGALQGLNLSNLNTERVGLQNMQLANDVSKLFASGTLNRNAIREWNKLGSRQKRNAVFSQVLLNTTRSIYPSDEEFEDFFTQTNGETNTL